MKKLLIILSILAFVLFSGCYRYISEDFKPPEVTNSALIPSPVQNPDTQAALQKAGDRLIKTLDPSTIFDANATVTHKNITYKINSVKASKSQSIFKDSEINDYTNLLRPDGNPKDGYSFLIINMTIKNDQNITVDQFLNSLLIYRIDENYDYRYQITCNEMRAFDHWQRDPEDKDHYEYKFKPNEETTFNFLYIAKDDELDKQLIVQVDNVPFSGKDYEDINFIRLNVQK